MARSKELRIASMQTYPHQLHFNPPLSRHTSKANENVACRLRRPVEHTKEERRIDHNLLSKWLSIAHSPCSSRPLTRTHSNAGDASLAITRDQQQLLGSFSTPVQEDLRSLRYKKTKVDNRSTSSV